MGLDGKVCVITGGGSGIGRATAKLMAEEGAAAIVVGRTASKLEAVKAEIQSAGGRSAALPLDVADHAAVNLMVRTVKEQFGQIDVLVNNAGHSSSHRKLLTTTPEDIRAVINSNLVGTIYCTQAVMPTMLEAEQGTVINVSSGAGVTPGMLGGMAYSAAKAGVINFTQYLIGEFKNSGVRFSVVIPGEIDTPILDKRPVPPSAEARGTMATAEDVAEAITLIARLPDRAVIPQLVIRPTMQRDSSGEAGVA